jgi:hypothetical protein
MRERWRRWAPYAVPALAFAAIVMAVFWRLWTPIDGAKRMFGWDAQWEYWGDLQFQLDAWRAGELPLWNPFDRGGYPFHADPQAGILYPITWLLLGVGFVVGSVPWWLISLKILLHFWLAGLGVYAFLRRRGVPAAAGYAGGLAFILSYPFLHNVFSALNWSMAWAPWALMAVDAWAEKPTRPRAALVALAFGMAYLAGALAAFWYGALVIGPYAVWALVHHGRAVTGEERRAYVRAATSTGGLAAGLWLGMVAAQLTATSALVPHTVREHRDYAFITDTAFTPDDLVSFVIPRFPGENCYLGLLVVMCMVAALTMRVTPRKLVLAGAALLGVLLAWGHIGGFLAPAASAFSPFGWFRRAHRYLYVCALPVAILGAEGLAELAALEGAELRRRVERVVIGAGALAVGVFAIAFMIKITTPDKEPYPAAYGLGFGVAAASAWVLRQLVAKDGWQRRAFLWIAAIVVGLDLMIAREHVTDRNMFPLPDTKGDRIVAKLDGVVATREVRIYDVEFLKFRPGIRLGVRDLGGYQGDPLALRRYAVVRDGVARGGRLAGHANVRWLLEGNKDKATGKGAAEKSALRPIPDVPNGSEVLRWAPAVMWVGGARVVDGGAAEAWAELTREDPGSIAVLERSSALDGVKEPGAAPAVAGRFTSYGRNRVVAEIDAPADGVVVIHEAYYPGWRATVDGKRVPIAPANALFRAVPVSAGHHRIEMSYHAPGWLVLAPISVLSVVGALVLALRRKRYNPTG